MNQYLIVFVTALSAALIMVPFLRQWAVTTGTVDQPDERKVHTTAVPRIGGIAIFMAFLFALLVHADLQPTLRGLLAGTLIIFFTGYVDDLNGITPRSKFLGEIGGCLVTMVVGNLYITNLGNLFGFGDILLPLWLAIPFTLFAIVGVINALNLIDGLDGLAGGVSVIALGAFFVLAWSTGNQAVMILCAALLGALLGFLKYNYYPARIFMGDTGSLVVGFLLGFIAVMLTQGGEGTISPILPVVILGLPIIDTLWVMISRVVIKKSPFAPDMTHVHHKFLNLGLQHRFTVIVIYGISLFWALFSLLLQGLPDYLMLGLFILVASSCYLVLRYVLRHPQRFPILQRDSAGGLRFSALYRQASTEADRLVPMLFALYLLYLGSNLLFGHMACGLSSNLFALLLVAGGGVLAWKRDLDNPLILSWLYLCTLVLVYAAESCHLLQGLASDRFEFFSDGLFWAIAILFGGKLLLRKEGELFLAGVDLLFLGVVIFSGVVISNFGSHPGLLTALFKGLLLVATLKIFIARRRAYGLTAVLVTLFLLLAGVVGQEL